MWPLRGGWGEGPSGYSRGPGHCPRPTSPRCVPHLPFDSMSVWDGLVIAFPPPTLLPSSLFFFFTRVVWLLTAVQGADFVTAPECSSCLNMLWLEVFRRSPSPEWFWRTRCPSGGQEAQCVDRAICRTNHSDRITDKTMRHGRLSECIIFTVIWGLAFPDLPWSLQFL